MKQRALLLMLPLTASAALAEEANYYFQPQYLASTLETRARRTDGQTGTMVDFNSTLGVDPTEPTAALDGFVRFRRIRMEIGYVRSELGGKADLTEALKFSGEDYAAGDRLFTDVESVRKRLVFGYDILDSKKLTLGAVAGVQKLELETQIKTRCCSSPDVDNFSQNTFVFGGSLGLHPFRDFAIHVRGVGTHRDGTRLVDTAISVEYLIHGRAGIGAGYAYYHINESEKSTGGSRLPDDHVDLTQEGWFVGLTLHL